MKKISFTVFSCLLLCSIFWFSCQTDKESDNTETEDTLVQFRSNSNIAGTYDIDNNITLLHTHEEYANIFMIFCSDNGYVNGTFIDVEILDNNPNDPGEVANLIVYGTYELNGCQTSIKLGHELIKDQFNYAAEGAGAKWSCEGRNCAACKPIRSWGKVVGCECLQIADDCGGPASCVHSTSGGGNGGLLLGWATLLLGLL